MGVRVLGLLVTGVLLVGCGGTTAGTAGTAPASTPAPTSAPSSAPASGEVVVASPRNGVVEDACVLLDEAAVVDGVGGAVRPSSSSDDTCVLDAEDGEGAVSVQVLDSDYNESAPESEPIGGNTTRVDEDEPGEGTGCDVSVALTLEDSAARFLSVRASGGIADPCTVARAVLESAFSRLPPL